MFIHNKSGDAVHLLAQDQNSRVWFCDAGTLPLPEITADADHTNPPDGVTVLPSSDFFSAHHEATPEELDKAQPGRIEDKSKAGDKVTGDKTKTGDKSPA